MYENDINVLKAIRKNFLKIVDGASLEQLNEIPEGFSNNLIWNIAHSLVTHQLLVYGLTKTPMRVSVDLVQRYRKGTKPEGVVLQKELDVIKGLLFQTVDDFEEDLEKNVFGVFSPYTTSFGFQVDDFSSAVAFNNTHEGLHLGYMMSICKFL